MPPEFWKPVMGTAPVVQAPWGETFNPPVKTIGGMASYNPFAVSCENSQRFVTWQFNRAYEANRYFPTPLRIQVLNAATITGMSLFIVLLTFLNDWYRMRRLAPAVRIAILLTAGVAWLLSVMLDTFGHAQTAQNAIAWISLGLRGYLLIFLVVPLAGIYWLVDKVFRECEFADNPRPPRFGKPD